MQGSHSRECQVRPRAGDQMTFTCQEQAASCRAQWDQDTRVRRSGGVFAPSGLARSLRLRASPTGVRFFLAEILDFLAKAQHVRLRELSKKKRRQFARACLPLVVYDCGCGLRRFLRAKKRRNPAAVAQGLAALKICVDRFHFKKGRSGCRPGGSCPLPAVWPDARPEARALVNSSAAEQSFAFVKRVAAPARCMTPARRFLFLLCMLHHRNVQLERRGQLAEAARLDKKRRFHESRRFHALSETLPVRASHLRNSARRCQRHEGQVLCNVISRLPISNLSTQACLRRTML